MSDGLDAQGLARLLEVLERSHHSITELRVLLELGQGRPASIPELAQALAERPAEVRPAAQRVVAQGLARSHHDGRAELVLLSITDAGLAAIRRLCAAAGAPPAVQEAATRSASPAAQPTTARRTP